MSAANNRIERLRNVYMSLREVCTLLKDQENVRVRVARANTYVWRELKEEVWREWLVQMQVPEIFDRFPPDKMPNSREVIKAERERHEALKEAVHTLLREYEKEQEEYGFPFNFALRDVHRKLRQMVKEEG